MKHGAKLNMALAIRNLDFDYFREVLFNANLLSFYDMHYNKGSNQEIRTFQYVDGPRWTTVRGCSDLNPFQLCTFQAHFSVIVGCLESSWWKSRRRYWKTTFWTSSGGPNILSLVLVHFSTCSWILQWSMSKTAFPLQIWDWNQRKRSFVEQFARLSNQNLAFSTSQTNNPAVIPYRDVLFIWT